MTNGLNKISLVLENCEVIDIDGKYIGELDVGNIQTSISRIACNSISKMKTCDNLVLSIHRDANIINKPFGFDSNQTVFDRLKDCDITAIDIHYDDVNDHSDENIYVPYNEEREGQLGSPNTYMTVKKNKFGDLFLVISEDKTVDDIFQDENINNAEEINFVWSMYDLNKGDEN